MDIKLVAKEFNYELSYAGKKEMIRSAVIVVPNGLSYHNPDSTSTVITSDLTVFPEDKNGNTINFSSVEEAQAWIDAYKDNLQFEIKNGNELHAIRNEFLIEQLYDSVMITDDKNRKWNVEAYTDGKAFFFTRESLSKLNDYWNSYFQTEDYNHVFFEFHKNGSIDFHDEQQDIVLPLKEENSLFKFPIRWPWITIDQKDLNASDELAEKTQSECKRIHDHLVKYIKDNHGKCPGMVESIISSDDDLVNSLVNIRRMDVPVEFLDMYDEAIQDPSVDLNSLISKNTWSNDSMYISDIEASAVAVKLGYIDGIYDFSEWEDALYDISFDLAKKLDQIADDGVIAKTEHNKEILLSLGLSEKDLYNMTMTDGAIERLAKHEDTPAIDRSDKSSNMIDFENYCSSRLSDLNKTVDLSGNEYHTLMFCEIGNEYDVPVVYIQGKENSLCWIDSNGTKHIDNNNAPDIMAARMNFESIDQKYYDQLIIHWNGLMMDKQIDLYKSRDLVSESISKDDETEYFVQF